MQALKIRSPFTALAFIVTIAALLLLCGLGHTYLWQDEAATAVLSERMLHYNRPLAYDGVNLITIDHFAAEDATSIDQRTGDPRPAVLFYVNRGDFKKDTTWKWQPWGQFVVAAASLKLLGATTLAARLPFAIAGILTILILYRFVLTYFKNSQMALLAAIFLVLNGYWILHARQCRYYSLSSLFLMLTLASYARWQDGRRAGAALFVLSAWCWFQVDYGTLWPVLGILFVDAVIADRRRIWRTVGVGLALAASIAPFAYYYEIWKRVSVPLDPWSQRFARNLYNINEYVAPLLIIAAAIAIWSVRRTSFRPLERRIIAISCASIVALLLWVPAAAPAAFLRYSILLAPLGCLLAAWVFVQVGKFTKPAVTLIGAAILLFTPWLSLPLHVLRPHTLHAAIVRPELKNLAETDFGHPPDPNRPVIEWLKQNAAPTDEILIDYEDIPLMFYLPNPIRGGIAAFRAEDDTRRPPDFLVLRHSVKFVHWPVFEREIERYRWTPVALEAPDIVCGSCSDPVERYDAARAPAIFVARRAPATEIAQHDSTSRAALPPDPHSQKPRSSVYSLPSPVN